MRLSLSLLSLLTLLRFTFISPDRSSIPHLTCNIIYIYFMYIPSKPLGAVLDVTAIFSVQQRARINTPSLALALCLKRVRSNMKCLYLNVALALAVVAATVKEEKKEIQQTHFLKASLVETVTGFLLLLLLLTFGFFFPNLYSLCYWY